MLERSWKIRPRVLALGACALLLFVYAGLAGRASRQMAPTFDEPLHAAAAWTITHRGDFRVNPEDPPLWQYWAAMPNFSAQLGGDKAQFAEIRNELAVHWWWVTDALFRTNKLTPGMDLDGDTFIRRSRAMMLIVALGLGVLIATWSWKLGGSVAAVGALALYALDPNFLGHGALVKNDVAFTLALVGVFFSLWKLGQRITPANTLALAFLCGVGLTVKFSGVLLIPMVGLALLIRVVMNRPWQLGQRQLDTRLKRLCATAAVSAVAAVVSFAMIWAVYQFRFAIGPDGQRFNERYFESWVAQHELGLKLGRTPTDGEIEQHQPSRVVRTVRFANRHKLLPNAYLMGFLYTHGSTLMRESYLNGELRATGWWYYFPLAMLYKTPLATLAAMALAAIVAVFALRAARKAKAQENSPPVGVLNTWTAACLAIPAGLYLLIAMRANVNLGLRHVLPVYPFIYIAAGLALAWAARRWMLPTCIVAAVLGAGLLAETLAAYPHYLAFFNAANSSPQKAAQHLGDSNLDWGQDLMRLAQWEKDHPTTRLYLAYFGTADPQAYGIGCIHLPGGYRLAADGKKPSTSFITGRGAIAVSVTYLQGLYQDDDLRERYQKLFKLPPTAVLGRSIWLYEQPEALDIFRAPAAAQPTRQPAR